MTFGPIQITPLMCRNIVLSACAYVVASWIGLMFAIPPGIASAVWPAAGLGLGIALNLGLHTLAGLFIGSFISNVYLAGNGFEHWQGLLLPAWIAMGSTLQSYAAVLLVKRLCKWPLSFESYPQLLRFFFISGVTTALCAPVVGVVGLAIFADLPAEAWLFSWFTWWVGDTLGIWFFTPIVMLVMDERFKNKLVYILLVSLSVFLLICSLFYYSRENFVQRISNHLDASAHEAIYQIESIESRINTNIRTMAAFYMASETVEKEEFNLFSGNVLMLNPVMEGVMWIPSGINNIEKSYVYTIDENNNTNFFQVLQDLENPLNEEGITVRQYDKEKVFFVYPLFKEGDVNNIRGYLVGVSYIEYWNNFLSGMLSDGNIDVAIYDENSNDEVYLSTNEDLYDAASYVQNIEFFDRKWKVKLHINKPELYFGEDWISWMFLVVGVLLGCIIQVFILSSLGFNLFLKRLVNERTLNLKQSNESLVKSSKAKSQFLANMSHEIRTPLNAVVGYCNLAIKKDFNEEALDYFDKIKKSSWLLINIVNDILDYSKLESKNMQLENKPVKLDSVCNNVASLFSCLAAEKGIEFSYELDEKLPPYLLLDEVRIEQVFINLCSNAVKFTEHGKVTLGVNLGAKGETLLVSIQDTGIGISPESREKVFSEFSQEDLSTTRRFGGTGLGLSICRKLVALMEGEIWLESEVGKGSTFFIEIPLLKTEEIPEQVIEFETLSGLENRRLLVVEDNMINQELIKEIMSDWQCEIVMANNGQDAIDILLDSNEFDAVLMDCQMPIMDGYEATKKIRSYKQWQQLPIIAMTANVMQEDVQRCLDAGMNAHTGKPIDEAILYQVLLRNIR